MDGLGWGHMGLGEKAEVPLGWSSGFLQSPRLPLSSVYWDYAVTIRLEEIVYLHCHQQGRDHRDIRRLGVHCGSPSLLTTSPVHSFSIPRHSRVPPQANGTTPLSVVALNHCNHLVKGWRPDTK